MPGLSINEVTTYRWSFEEDVAHYPACGIEAIGVWRQKLADFGEAKGIELLAASGLAVSNLLWAGGFTGSDGHSYQEAVDDARHALRLAAALGTQHLVVYSGSRNGHTQNHARRIFITALDELLPLAEELRITLDIEPMHQGCAEGWTFLTDLEDGLALVRGYEHPRVKLAFDTYHWGHEPDIAARLADMAPDIGIVHLSDGQWRLAKNRIGASSAKAACRWGAS